MSETLRPRIASLLPSATEIVCALGLRDHLVGVTHECDYPAGVEQLPHLTANRIAGVQASKDIDAAVRAALTDDAHSVYALHEELLHELAPDLVLTQALCDVCAVPASTVENTVCTMPQQARVLSLDPLTINGVLASIEDTGEAAGVPGKAREVTRDLQARLDDIKRATEGAHRPRVFAAEWLDPLFCGGHWVPEMIAHAGGVDPLGEGGERSRQVSWEEVEAADPDVVVLMPCGFGADEVVQRYEEIATPAFASLRAVREGEVYAVDATSYFSRPGPRVVEGTHILAHILHPDRVAEEFPGGVAVRLGQVGSGR